MSLIQKLAEFTKSKSDDGLFILPETYGEGYIKSFNFGTQLNMMISQCEFKEEMIIKRAGGNSRKDEITFSFRNLFQQDKTQNPEGLALKRSIAMPSVQVSAGDIDIEVIIPEKTKINTIVITIHMDLLKSWISDKAENKFLNTITLSDKPYLYDQIISNEIEQVASKIALVNNEEELSHFYLKLKTEEMIYLFLSELSKRETITNYPLNVADVKAMYAIKETLCSDLSNPPDLTHLAFISNMSESKMNKLFKQIFGNSIYNYYQALRMNEAAYLIREEKLSVSETGYRLGFSNLSHFSRIFEKHIGLKPKKYSAVSTS
ncbi:HTH-type transcriptional activator RhaR [Flavobacterium bizetiae]|uniref:HTH-type transcriptional activator RhaR n=1 Tax=Flavobacterium bizetiae TaxID=2704140 RepID=A0A6J4GPB6_9FLAO|nr:AraC family transcriptional regulator [Flavobacterium bizetiae]CAA9200098.1 HTH-type transcriptional activator RhaR [Flavobacterium bizetiae]CAD5343449.1 HTH-type transcriptional activator RhaR [Flavobacterium bizetiae]CAD5349442.1 HTH-type transcriptional activator RhaR [Flavobacterium bizetiae]